MGCGTLTTIILNQLPGLRDGCIQVFKLNVTCAHDSNLFFLYVQNCLHFFRILKALTSECRTLKNVSIMNSPFLSDAAFKCLASCKKLNKIRVEGEFNLSFSESFHLEKFLVEYA